MALVLPLVVLFWATGGSLGAVVIGAAAAFVGVHLHETKRLPSAEAPSEDVLEAERRVMAEPLTPAEQSYRRRACMGNRVVERALRAAVFGVVWFPPLLIMTAALLWRLDPKKTPLGPWRREQISLAWCLCGGGLLLLLFYVALSADVTGDAVGLMGKWW